MSTINGDLRKVTKSFATLKKSHVKIYVNISFRAELVPVTFGAADDGEDQAGGGSGSGGGIGLSGLGPASPNDDGLGAAGGGGPPTGGGKISKAAVLQRSIEYIHFTQVSPLSDV